MSDEISIDLSTELGGSEDLVAESTPNETEASEAVSSIDFTSYIPEDLKDEKYWSSVKDLPDLMKQFGNLQKLLGKRPTGVPAADAPAEDWQKFYETLRPETPDAYELEFPKTDEKLAALFGENDEAYMQSIKQIMFDAGLTKDQAQKVITAYAEKQIEAVAPYLEKIEVFNQSQEKAFEDAMVNRFGANYQKAMDTANGLIAKHMPKEFLELANEGSLFTGAEMAAMVSMLNSIAGQFKEDSDPFARPSDGASNATNFGAKALELQKSPEYQDVFHPQHEAVRKQVRELLQKQLQAEK